MHRDRQAPASTPRGGEWFVVRHELDVALYVLLAMKKLGRDLNEVEQVRRVQRVRQREMAAETNAERPRHRTGSAGEVKRTVWKASSILRGTEGSNPLPSTGESCVRTGDIGNGTY